MAEDEKKVEEVKAEGKDENKETAAPVSEICANAEGAAADLVEDDSEIKPTQGFFLTSQRWH